MKNFGEKQYIHLVKNILNEGVIRKNRNGSMKSIFGAMMKYDLRENTMPILTSKKMAWKTCVKELFWFIKGGILNKELQNQNVHIWDGNSSKEFLQSRNLEHYCDTIGELGPIYGFQWRNFNGDYQKYLINSAIDLICRNNELYDTHTRNKVLKYENDGIDQLQQCIDILQGKHKYEDKYSRRLIVSAWNPQQLHMMALPPCHVMFQFHVSKNKYDEDELSCSLYQRSGDLALGIPFNIISYSFLTHIVAHLCGMKPGMFIHHLGDVHIYKEHEDGLKKQIKAFYDSSYDFPKIKFTMENIPKSIEDYSIHSIQIQDYKCCPKIEYPMIV